MPQLHELPGSETLLGGINLGFTVGIQEVCSYQCNTRMRIHT